MLNNKTKMNNNILNIKLMAFATHMRMCMMLHWQHKCVLYYVNTFKTVTLCYDDAKL